MTAALLARPAPEAGWARLWQVPREDLSAMARKHRDFPVLNTPHAFAGALQDSLAMVILAAWSGDASAGYWALALRYLKAPAGLVGGALSQALYPRLVAARNGSDALRVVRQSMALLLLMALPLMVILMLWGPCCSRLSLVSAGMTLDCWRGLWHPILHCTLSLRLCR